MGRRTSRGSTRRRGCPTRKTRWASREAAEEELLGVRMKNLVKNNPRRREVRVYECPMCLGWHLSSKA
jgi:hypothetical protein